MAVAPSVCLIQNPMGGSTPLETCINLTHGVGDEILHVTTQFRGGAVLHVRPDFEGLKLWLLSLPSANPERCAPSFRIKAFPEK